MKSKRILLLCGHPGETSFNAALAAAYQVGAKKAGHEIQRLDLSGMAFDVNIRGGRYPAQPLERDLQTFWDHLMWSAHFVLTHPLWWGSHPARLKGLFDRTLLPGAAFGPSKGGGFPNPMLRGRSTRVIITSDTPGWYLRLGYGSAVLKQTDRQIFRFCGMKPNRFSLFAPVGSSSGATRANWLARVEALGQSAA